MTSLATQVLIIGGGATGTGLARDLALRGVQCLLVDQRDVNTGASGANHGLLHSGGRYVSGDAESATHCRQEGELLKRLAPHCVENTGGLFVAVEGDDERYIADFPGFCARCGIPARAVDPAQARAIEPALSDRVIAAYETEDATVDPFKLSLENMSQAVRLGSTLRTHARVVAFELGPRGIAAATIVDTRTGEETTVHAEQVVNAAGAWSAQVAALAGIPIDILYSKGTLLITQNRVTRRVINRLRKPANADIIVPGGTVSVLGTTSVRIDSLDVIAPTVAEVDTILDETTAMVPELAATRIIRAYAGVRPLVRQGGSGDDRAVSRDLTLVDHGAQGVDNFVTITGGKLTTYRYMAEKAADLVCRHLGISAPCRTREEPLPRSIPWTVPGMSPRVWAEAGNPADTLLCECEMVPRSAIDHIVSSFLDPARAPALKDIAQRSRVGKGSCQGSFCALRVLGHLAERDKLDGAQGLGQLRAFLNERWKGEQAVFFGTQLRQAELKEALHCCLLGLEL